MRESNVGDVLSWHLRRIRVRRDELRRRVSGTGTLFVPTAAERHEAEAAYLGLGDAERGLLEIAKRLGAASDSDRELGTRALAAATTVVRDAAAVFAMLLQQPEAAPVVPADLDAADAAFRYLQSEVQRMAADAAAAKDTKHDPPYPPKPRDPAKAFERMVIIGGWGGLAGAPF